MLDLQNLQKSSEPQLELETQAAHHRVYTNREEALRDFDLEIQSDRSKADVKAQADEKLLSLIANARLLMKHKEMGLALNLLRTATNRESKNPVVLSLLAECLEKSSRLEEALKVRTVAVTVDCTFDQVQKLATVYYKLGQDEKALGKYYEALSLLTEETEDLFEVYKNLGNILVRQNDFEGAEEYYNKAYTLNPRSDILLVNFGTLEVQRQDYDKSLYCFRQAVDVNRKNDKAWVGLAMVHSQFGDHELAWANLETAVDINPSNRTAVQLLANWGVRDQRITQSTEVLENYLSKVEFDEDLSLVLINLYCMSSQVLQAQLECERVLLWNPKNQQVAELRGKLKNLKRA
jgi:tetratricopeptide (TPR) repeat protein